MVDGTRRALTLKLHTQKVGIVKLPPSEAPPAWATESELWSVTRTAQELSIVCPFSSIPEDVARNGPWRCFEVAGPLDFSLVGILHSLSEPLARSGVSIFAISTHDTDWVLVQEAQVDRAVEALRSAGHQLEVEA